MVLALAALVVPPELHAAHGQFDYSQIDGGGTCYNCHTLDRSEGNGAEGTSYINPNSRGGIFNLMKSYSSGATPANLGCVFCHNNPSNSKMKGVLNHFLGGWASKHPVGYSWATQSNTNNEYLSTAGSTTANELDCVDCHDTSLLSVGSYVNHASPPAGNPYYLKNVTTDGRYDNLCRICHQNTPVNVAGKGHVITLSSHSQGTIVEADGTALKTNTGVNGQCTKCHDTHYSTRVRLFNDGHEGDTPIVGTDCLSVCHFPGDDVNFADDTSASGNTYNRRGHGRELSTYKYKWGAVDFTGAYKTMQMGCTSCHLPLDTGTTDGSRKPHVEKNPSGTTNAEVYAKKYNIGLTMQDEGNGSAYGNPILGVCENCHSAYESHTAAVGVVSGCQDCHDEHGENSGTVANVFMIPIVGKKTGTYSSSPPRTLAGTESVIYTSTRYDPATGTERSSGLGFYGPGDTGVCDNTECHATSLATYFATGAHPAGSESVGSDCKGCHPHNGDPAGGWRATEGCGTCHDYPGVTHVTGAAALSSAHDAHLAAIGQGAACDRCHPGNPPIGHPTDTSTGTNQAEVIRMVTVSGTTPDKWVYLQGSTATSGTAIFFSDADKEDDPNGYFAKTDSRCYLVSCHLEGTTPAWDATITSATACSECHSNITTHVTMVKGSGSAYACTACHPGGAAYPDRHSKNNSSSVVLVPNNPNVGIDFAMDGANGIFLGGDLTAAWGIASEAELCWRCHDQNGDGDLNDAGDVSEWGANNRTSYAVGSSYDYGSLDGRNWTTATWTSGTPAFAYKSKAISSTHAANTEGGARSGVDDASAIRCSYCHDVHDLNHQKDDTTSGKPFLRGQWIQNPYKEDGAPRSGTTYTDQGGFGAVPRASTAQATMGGYWIDQNSGNPVSGLSPSTFGGLCALCHASPAGAQTWNAAQIGSINQYGSAADWVSGWNGHANSVKGGGGAGSGAEAAARNIFNARGGDTIVANNNPLAHYEGTTEPAKQGNYGFRGYSPAALAYQPPISGEDHQYQVDEWGVDESGSLTQGSYHAFPCSKCHDPHASGLPRLMITNCLDTKHNAWDDSYQTVGVPSTMNNGRRMSQWSSAQNCHRLVDSTPTDGGSGWNKVTPW